MGGVRQHAEPGPVQRGTHGDKARDKGAARPDAAARA